MNYNKENKNALIVGGTSGLGLELALLLSDKYKVSITGRHNPEKEKLEFKYLNLSAWSPLPTRSLNLG